MLTASSKFKAALSASHRVVTRLAIYQPDEAGDYQLVGHYGITSGSMSIDYRRNIRRQVSGLTVAPITSEADAGFSRVLSQRDFLESLASTSAEIVIEWGIVFPDGDSEFVELGRLRVEEWTRNQLTAGVEVTSAFDGAGRVTDFPLVMPYAPYDTGGTKLTYLEAIQELVELAYPTAHPPTWHVHPDVDDSSLPPDNTAFTGDRWTAINALAKAIDVVVGVDHTGDWTIVPARSSREAVWTVKSGPDGALVDESTQFSRREQYNAVPVRWEDPVGGGGLAYVVDSDPESPTYYDGPFGRKPRPEETIDTITTSDQAIAAATTLLDQYKGLTRSVSLTSLHNPLLESNDVIALVLPDGTGELHVVDSISLPLSDGTMTMETRVLRAGLPYSSSVVYSSSYSYSGDDT